MAKSKSDKAIEYASYAKHCLQVVEVLPDRDSRTIHREMAAEWLKLAGEAAQEGAALGSQASLHMSGNKLEQYTEVSRRTIDTDILQELTDDDLAELGISLGNRDR